jgi:putative membrane protein
MSEPKRLHPISAVANFLKQLKELIVPFFLFVIFGSRGLDLDLFVILISIGILVIILTVGFLSWLRFTYRIEDGELRIEHGLFVRKKRYIPFERIQSIDLSEGILQRPFGLVKVVVETAGSSGMDDAEAVLTAISKAEAKLIQVTVASVKRDAVMDEDREVQETPSSHIYKISVKELLLLASTSGGVGVVISAVMAFIFQFEEIIPYEAIFNKFEKFVATGAIFISIIVFIGFVLAWVAAIVGTMVKYADFTVKKVGNDIIITRGLLEKRQFTIPVNRIQAVRISENLLRQPLGYATVYLESAGGSISNQEGSKVMILPFIKKNKVSEILQACLADYKLDVPIAPLPKRAFKRYVIRGWLGVLLFVAVPIVFFRPWGYLSLVLILASFLFSWLNFKAAGWSLHDNQLTLSYRHLIKNTVFMRKTKIQSISMQESYFQKKKDLGNIEAGVASGFGLAGGKVVDLESKDIQSIYEWYSREEK